MTHDTSVDTLLQLGHNQLDRRQDRKALETFQQAQKREPQNPQALYGLGLACYRLERYREAINYLNRALEIKPYYILALVRRGLTYKELTQNQEATTDFETAISIEPQAPEDWRGRGIALNELKRYEEAIFSYDKAIEINPHPHYAWYSLGYTKHHLRQYEEAIASYNKAIEINPDYCDAWNSQGHTLKELQRYEEALESFDEAIKINQDFFYAFYSRGNLLYELRRYEEAIVSYDKVIEINSDYFDAWNGRGYTLKELQRYEEALESFDKAIKINQDFFYAWNGRGHTLKELQQYEEALESFDKAIKINQDFFYAFYSRGNVLYELRRYEEAIISYNRVIEINSDYFDAWNWRGNALKELGQYEEANASYKKAEGINADYFHYNEWYNHADLLCNLHQYKEAIESYKKTIEINPNYYLAWHGQGNALHNLRQYKDAIESYQKAIKINPNYYLAWYGWALCLRDLKHYQEAIPKFDEALRLTNKQYWQVWGNRGIALFNSGNYEGAIQNCNESISAIKKDAPDYQRASGELYRVKGYLLHLYGKRLITNKQILRAPTIGDSPDVYSKKHIESFSLWLQAKTSYETAFKFLTVDKFPERNLEVLQEFIKLCADLGDNNAIEELLEKGTDNLEELLRQSKDEEQKIALARKFPAFDQLRVDIRTQSLEEKKKIEALELAEKRKNKCLKWMWKDWNFPSPTYQKIQGLLNSKTAIIYWHVSPNAITTFILRYQQPLIVQTLKPATHKKYVLGLIDEPIKLENSDYIPAIQQLEEFENWLKAWKKDYQNYRQKSIDALSSENTSDNSSAANEKHPWRERMESQLSELARILNINKILSELKDITQLILIPHRDLHLLPLHYLFNNASINLAQRNANNGEGFSITYLPSALLGLNLQTPKSITSIVNLENPRRDLHFATITANVISWLYRDRRNVDISPITRDGLIQALQKNAGTFNFTGHAYHNNVDPKNSALVLAKNQTLTLEDIFNNLYFNNHDLVCLSACETGITSPDNLIDEYVGLVSGFLAKGASYVISTLWVVNELSTALLIIKFYELFKAGVSPAVALKKSQNWLRELTYAKLAKWYLNLAEQMAQVNRHCSAYLQTLARAIENDRVKMRNNVPPFEHPYHWAGFILTGKYSEN